MTDEEKQKAQARADMIQAFWAYLSHRAGYTTRFNALALLSEQECAQFDVALDDIVDARVRSRK